MADAAVPHLSSIRKRDPELGRALEYLEKVANNLAVQTNASPVGVTPPPAPHSGLTVTGGGGVLDVAIQDGSPQYRGKSNFVEVADNPSFTNAHVVELGAGRNARIATGPGTFHVRTCAAMPTSGPSAYLNHPPVSTAGATPPPMSLGQGAGTGGGGYGVAIYNTSTPPKRG